MRIALRQEEYDFLLNMLMHVDKRSYDPVYKNIAERIEKTASAEGPDMVVPLEETEIYNTLDALNEYIDEAENGNYSEEESKKRVEIAEDFIELLGEETGIRV